MAVWYFGSGRSPMKRRIVIHTASAAYLKGKLQPVSSHQGSGGGGQAMLNLPGSPLWSLCTSAGDKTLPVPQVIVLPAAHILSECWAGCWLGSHIQAPCLCYHKCVCEPYKGFAAWQEMPALPRGRDWQLLTHCRGEEEPQCRQVHGWCNMRYSHAGSIQFCSCTAGYGTSSSLLALHWCVQQGKKQLLQLPRSFTSGTEATISIAHCLSPEHLIVLTPRYREGPSSLMLLPSNIHCLTITQSILVGQGPWTHVQQISVSQNGNFSCPLAGGLPRLAPTHPALLKVFHPLPHQLVSFIFMVQERLLEGPADVCVCCCALEIRGSKLGKFVLWEVFFLLLRERQCCIQVLFLQLLLDLLKILLWKEMSDTQHSFGYQTIISLWAWFFCQSDFHP